MSEVLHYRGATSGSNPTGITEVSNANPLPTTPTPATSAPTTATVTVTNSATQLLSASTTRRGVFIVNGSGAAITLGPAGVASAATQTLAANGVAALDNYGGELYAVTPSGTSVVTVFTW